MIEPVLIDSDTLSELSRGHARVVEAARAYLVAQGRLTLSAVTVFERMRGYRAAIRAGKPFEEHEQSFRALVAVSRVLPVDVGVAERAATLWAGLSARKRQALGDILIASTASVHGFPLVTRNVRYFAPMAKLLAPGALRLLDWTR